MGNNVFPRFVISIAFGSSPPQHLFVGAGVWLCMSVQLCVCKPSGSWSSAHLTQREGREMERGAKGANTGERKRRKAPTFKTANFKSYYKKLKSRKRLAVISEDDTLTCVQERFFCISQLHANPIVATTLWRVTGRCAAIFSA